MVRWKRRPSVKNRSLADPDHIIYIVGVEWESALAHFPWGQSATFQCQPHGREYEDCKQILKLSLNPTHTYNARQDFSQHSCQKTCPMGRAVSEGLRPLHFYNSLRSIGATANLVIPPKIAYLYTNKINLRETLTKHHNHAEDSGLNRSPILQCSRMAILDTICLLRHQ